jgi:hypothetical protein
LFGFLRSHFQNAVVISIDQSENFVNAHNLELTCQGGSPLRTCARCLCVAKHRWDPDFDGQEWGGTGGFKTEAFACMSSEHCVKDPDRRTA